MALTKVTNRMMAGAVANALDYGADPTGATDSASAIQAAIDSGLPAYLPAGDYYIQSPLYLDEDKALIGDGRGRTSITKSSETLGSGSNTARSGAVTDSYAKDAIIIIRHADGGYASRVTLRGLGIKGRTDFATDYAIYAPRISKCVFEDLEILRGLYHFYTHDAWLCRFESVTVDGQTSVGSGFSSTSYGFYWADDGTGGPTGTSLNMENCYAKNVHIGYRLFGLSYSSMNSCASDNILNRAYWMHLTNITMSGCGCENVTCNSAAYFFENARVTMNNCRSDSVSGNSSDTSTAVLFLTGSDTNVTMNSCRFQDMVSAGVSANIFVTNGATLTSHNTDFPTNGSSSVGYTSGAVWHKIDNDEFDIKSSGQTIQLNEYDYGTHGPTVAPSTSGTITLNTSYDLLGYVKDKDVVTVSGNIRVTSVSSPVGSWVNISLPTTVAAGSDGSAWGTAYASYYDASATSYSSVRMDIRPSVNTVRLMRDASTVAASDEIQFTLTYQSA